MAFECSQNLINCSHLLHAAQGWNCLWRAWCQAGSYSRTLFLQRKLTGGGATHAFVCCTNTLVSNKARKEKKHKKVTVESRNVESSDKVTKLATLTAKRLCGWLTMYFFPLQDSWTIGWMRKYIQSLSHTMLSCRCIKMNRCLKMFPPSKAIIWKQCLIKMILPTVLQW